MKINYQKVLDEELSNLTYRPKLLLHSCCGPCSSYVLNYLVKYFDITVFYYNPNIYPHDEYKKRLSNQIKLINEMGDNAIDIVDTVYDDVDYYNYVAGYEDEKEGGVRCHLCFMYRLEKTAKYAKENGYDYFTTTLSVSPYKNSEVLNKIGKVLEDKYEVKYLYSDFKKKEGYKKSIELSKKYDLYRQHYCGCKYSYFDSLNMKCN